MNRILPFAAVVIAFTAGASEGSDREMAALYGRGAYQLRSGFVDGALATFSEVVEAGSRDPRVFFYRGVAFDQTGAADQALGDYQTAAALERTRYGASFDVDRALEPIQGYTRARIEQVRRDVRLASVKEVRSLLAAGLTPRSDRRVVASPEPVRDDPPAPPAMVDEGPAPATYEEPAIAFPSAQGETPDASPDAEAPQPEPTADELLFPEPQEETFAPEETDPVDDLLNSLPEETADDFLNAFDEASQGAEAAAADAVDDLDQMFAPTTEETPPVEAPAAADEVDDFFNEAFGDDPPVSAPKPANDPLDEMFAPDASAPAADAAEDAEESPQVSTSALGSIFNRVFVEPVADAAQSVQQGLEQGMPMQQGGGFPGGGPPGPAGFPANQGPAPDFGGDDDLDALFGDDAPPADAGPAGAGPADFGPSDFGAPPSQEFPAEGPAPGAAAEPQLAAPPADAPPADGDDDLDALFDL